MLDSPPAVLFLEVDGILVEEVWSRFAERLAEAVAIDARSVGRTLLARRRPFERGTEELDAFARSVTLELEIELDVPRFAELLLEGSVVPHPENVELLQRARERFGTRLFALSNLPRPVYERAEAALALSGWLDGELLAHREAVGKPSAQIYVQALDLARAPPGETLLLDVEEENLRAAGEWGIPGVLVPGPSSLAERLAASWPGFGDDPADPPR